MFDQKKAVEEWKRSLRKIESLEDGVVAELESHLLDEFDRQRRNGLSDDEAFARAVAVVGRPEDIGGDYFRDSRRSVLAVPSWSRSSVGPGLLLNYLKVSLRSILRRKGYSLINVTGLAIGIACSLLILLWIRDELSYDRFHTNRKDIYRVTTVSDAFSGFCAPAPFAPAIEAEIPEVISAVRVGRNPRAIFKHEGRAYYEENGITADASLFRIFSFPLKKGDAGTIFADPFSIVISESMAKKYFSGKDPIGQSLLVEGVATLTVTGIMEEIPHNSHFRFDYVIPVPVAEFFDIWGMDWGDFNFMTYFQAAPARDEAEIVRKLNRVAYEHGCPQIVHKQCSFAIQRLDDIYLNPLPGGYDIPLGNKKQVYLFSLIALFILLIACINFINLTTARAEKRAKEVSLRKVVGAGRAQIVGQFFGETTLMTMLALVLGVALAFMAVPRFNELTGKQLTLSVLDPGLALILVGIAVFVGIVAGVFPSLYLSSFQPAQVLKGSAPLICFTKSRSVRWVGRGALRRLLVIVQFAISVMLMLGTAVVFRQLKLIHEKSWSSGKDIVLHIPFKENIAAKYDFVRSEILKDPAVIGVAAKDCLPTFLNNNTNGVSWEGKTADQNHLSMETTAVDVNYFATMGMGIAEGRGFSADFPGDVGAAYVLNEEAIKLAGIVNPVGQSFSLYRNKGTIVGVVRNTIFQSLRQRVRAQVFYLFTNLPEESDVGVVLIRVRGDLPKASLDVTIARIERIWKSVNQWAPFEWHFLSEAIEAQYGSERRESRLSAAFSLLAILISCLGLIGLASFVAEQRTKEIGIRKTLGASVPGILFMLAREFGKWVLIANVIAWPIAYVVMNEWLQSFVYRTSPGILMFALVGCGTLLIALVTVVSQTLRVAWANPVVSLRYE